MEPMVRENVGVGVNVSVGVSLVVGVGVLVCVGVSVARADIVCTSVVCNCISEGAQATKNKTKIKIYFFTFPLQHNNRK